MMIDNCYGGDRLTQDTGVSTVTADPKWFSAVNETESEVAVAKSKDSRFGTGRFSDLSITINNYYTVFVFRKFSK